MSNLKPGDKAYERARSAYYHAFELEADNPVDAATHVGFDAGVVSERARIVVAIREIASNHDVEYADVMSAEVMGYLADKIEATS